ncbi:hypothetical protein [Pelosinus baikalensis]|uniref:Uncharacterized protein n=1 Tax=Pelosinus baikalensis TaxID=2892015 RepID=A0ABS8HQU0_9FIRM|nr:hypothetical protein [Pelosinus baikalensis]MCC5465546.1 hypothetical protein [Pelosinus baikalensis]
MLDELKDILDIIGNDRDASLEKIILRGKDKIEGLAGVVLDFSAEGLPKFLLLNYCRYDYNNAPEYFEENFKSEILRMQLQAAVIANVAE